jgi:anti-sigma factor RsiW
VTEVLEVEVPVEVPVLDKTATAAAFVAGVGVALLAPVLVPAGIKLLAGSATAGVVCCIVV